MQLNKVARLKIAAMILFWFGVFFEFLVLADLPTEYYKRGTVGGIPLEIQLSTWVTILNLVYNEFIHVAHIMTGYWLSKGTKHGVVLGVVVGIYETASWISGNLHTGLLFNPDSIAFRILFAIVIFLIISGRKDLDKLQTEKWRPWSVLKRYYGQKYF